MDIENHNTDRKKPVRRKQFSAAVFIAVLVGIVLMVFRYFSFVSKTIYEESVSHLTEVFHQSDNMMRELTDKNLTYLHMWGESLQDILGEDEICDYIKKAQEDTGFLDFFFLSADGNYKMATGETGYLGLQENMEEEIRQGNDVIANAAVPGKSQLLVFATPKVHGIYQGFEYDAIAIAYENSDIVDVLDISAFDGNAQSFMIHPDGRVVVDHSFDAWGNVYNFFGILREHSDMSEKEINALLEKFKAGRTDAMLLNLDGRNYYLVYEKSDIQDWMFLEIQLQAAFADGELHPNEREVLFVIADELGISRAQFDQFLRMMQGGAQFGGGSQQRSYGQHGGNAGWQQAQRGPTLEDACNVLGVKPTDDAATVKRAYRKLMNEHHPDKLVAKGLPPEMMEMAKQKAQEIQKAWELIKEQRGF